MTFRTVHFDGSAYVPSYMDWVVDCDMRGTYRVSPSRAAAAAVALPAAFVALEDAGAHVRSRRAARRVPERALPVESPRSGEGARVGVQPGALHAQLEQRPRRRARARRGDDRAVVGRPWGAPWSSGRTSATIASPTSPSPISRSIRWARSSVPTAHRCRHSRGVSRAGVTAVGRTPRARITRLARVRAHRLRHRRRHRAGRASPRTWPPSTPPRYHVERAESGGVSAPYSGTLTTPLSVAGEAFGGVVGEGVVEHEVAARLVLGHASGRERVALAVVATHGSLAALAGTPRHHSFLNGADHDGSSRVRGSTAAGGGCEHGSRGARSGAHEMSRVTFCTNWSSSRTM